MIKINKTIKLYDCFEKWSVFENIYLYGDPHFGDLESYKLRFPDEYEAMLLNAEQYGHPKEGDEKEFIEELDEMQVKNINKVCGKNDILIILGDVGNIEYVKKLKAGYKVLILGNHDRGYSYYKRNINAYNKQLKQVAESLYPSGYFPEDNHLFDEVYEGTLQINPKIMLSHEPVEYKYCLNIHGHNHFGPTCNNKVNVSKEGHFNAIAEAINYKPISLSVLLQRGLASKIPDIHQETVDNANKKLDIIK